MKATAAIQVLPAAEGDAEVIRIVDAVIAYIRSTGLRYDVGPFETTVEGDDYDQIMDVMKECQRVALRAGAPWVSAYIRVVWCPDDEGVMTIDEKISRYHQP